MFSKRFSLILDNRLRSWVEENNFLTKKQLGFRKQNIIYKVINHEKKTIYCTFNGLKKRLT